MTLKEKLLKLFKDEEVKEVEESINTESSIFKEAVKKEAARLVDEELKTLDKEFIKSLSEMIKPVDYTNNQSSKSEEEKIKEILKNE